MAKEIRLANEGSRRREIVRAECKDCNGTGVYQGFTEGKRVGALCWSCEGTGEIKIVYSPFNGRRAQKGIDIVWAREPGSAVVKEKELIFKLGIPHMTADQFRSGGIPPWIYVNSVNGKIMSWSIVGK